MMFISFYIQNHKHILLSYVSLHISPAKLTLAVSLRESQSDIATRGLCVTTERKSSGRRNLPEMQFLFYHKKDSGKNYI